MSHSQFRRLKAYTDTCRALFARAKGLAPKGPRRQNPRSHPNSSQKEPSSPSGCYGHGPGAQAGVSTPRLAGSAQEADLRASALLWPLPLIRLLPISELLSFSRLLPFSGLLSFSGLLPLSQIEKFEITNRQNKDELPCPCLGRVGNRPDPQIRTHTSPEHK